MVLNRKRRMEGGLTVPATADAFSRSECAVTGIVSTIGPDTYVQGLGFSTIGPDTYVQGSSSSSSLSSLSDSQVTFNLEWCDKIKLSNLLLPRSEFRVQRLGIAFPQDSGCGVCGMHQRPGHLQYEQALSKTRCSPHPPNPKHTLALQVAWPICQLENSPKACTTEAGIDGRERG